MTTETHAEMATILGEVLGPKYEDITYWKEGGTRLVFRAKWGPGKEERVIKVDKPRASHLSPRAQRHIERGYTTDNDIRVLAEIPDAEQHGLMRLLDYADLRQRGYEGSALSEPYFESLTLEEVVQQRGPLPFAPAHRIFSKVFDGGNHLTKSTGRLHRDPKPSNILIGVNKREGEVRITDYANSAPKTAMTSKYNPTAGSVQVTDWRLMSPFTGKNAVYDEQAEVFAYGSAYLYARLGKSFAEIDPDLGRAVIPSTGENLVNANGHIDPERYERALRTASRPLKRGERAFIRRCLTSNLKERYASLDEMVEGFRQTQGIWKTMRTSEKIGVSAFAAFLAGMMGVVATSYMDAGPMAEAWRSAYSTKEDSRFDVSATWNGKGPELKNGLVDIEYTAFVYVPGGGRAEIYPSDTRYLRAQPGNTLDSHIVAREIPRPKNDEIQNVATPTLRGRVYIEGLPLQKKMSEVWDFEQKKSVMKEVIVNDFWVRPYNTDETTEYHERGGQGAGNVSLTVPDVPAGTYITTVEIYEPTSDMLARWAENEKGTDGVKIANPARALAFNNPGKVLARQRIPLVIGSPEQALDISYIQFNGGYGSPSASYRNLLDSTSFSPYTLGSSDSTRGLTLEFRVPEENFVQTLDGTKNYHFISLPKENPSGSDQLGLRTLEIIGRDASGAGVYYTAFPIERKLKYTIKDTGREVYGWEFGFPDQSFSEKLVEHRKNSLGSGKKTD